MCIFPISFVVCHGKEGYLDKICHALYPCELKSLRFGFWRILPGEIWWTFTVTFVQESMLSFTVMDTYYNRKPHVSDLDLDFWCFCMLKGVLLTKFSLLPHSVQMPRASDLNFSLLYQPKPNCRTIKFMNWLFHSSLEVIPFKVLWLILSFYEVKVPRMFRQNQNFCTITIEFQIFQTILAYNNQGFWLWNMHDGYINGSLKIFLFVSPSQ